MKKILSLVLCLAIFMSVFTVAVSAGESDDLFIVDTKGFEKGKITYTISVRKGIPVTATTFKFEYDPDVLEINDKNSAKKTDAYGDETDRIPGIYEFGKQYDTEGVFTIAHCNTETFANEKSDTPYVYITFALKSGVGNPKTSVKISCYEFLSGEATPELNIDQKAPNVLLKNDSALVTLDTLNVTSVESGKDSVSLAWNKVTGADSYEIKRYDEADGWVTLTSSCTQVNYTDDTVDSNKEYTYRLRAKNSAGKATYYTEVKHTYLDSAAVKASQSSNKATLTWKSVAGASSYSVYRRKLNTDGSKSGWTKIASSVKELKYIDEMPVGTKIEAYEYTVTSVAKDKSESAKYNFAQAKSVPIPTYSLKAETNGIKVTWNQVEGATKYRVYKKINNGSWETLGDYEHIDGAKKNSFVDKKASGGKTNYYRIKAFTSGATSYVKTKSLDFLKAPEFEVTNTSSGVKISWSKVTGAKKYVVYRKTEDGAFKKLGSTTELKYVDKTAESGTLYYYTVKAYNGSYSAGYEDAGKIVYLTAPNTTKATSSKSGITVTWKNIAGETGYIVYRKTSGGSWERIGTATKNTFVDKNAKKGKTYSYKVKAYVKPKDYDKNSKETFYSYAGSSISCKDKY